MAVLFPRYRVVARASGSGRLVLLSSTHVGVGAVVRSRVAQEPVATPSDGEKPPHAWNTSLASDTPMRPSGKLNGWQMARA